MNKEKVFLILGGDLRQTYLAEILANEKTVFTYGLDENSTIEKPTVIKSLADLKSKVDYLVLPIPAMSDGLYINTQFLKEKISLEDVIGYLKENATVMGGVISKETKDYLTSKGFDVIDLLEREELTVLNAVPTAEGAIQIAMEEMPTTIYGQKVLITGMGRISKVLIKILIGLGADVCITARKYSDLAWARIYGCKSVHITQIENELSYFDLVINTVPAVVLDKNRLSLLKENCLVIDLASKPGGVDFDTAGSLGVKTIWALSLPGKVAPVTSGEIIAGTILNILDERGEDK